MKRIIFLLLISFLILSCAPYEFYPYVTFEEATAYITEQYGEPGLIKDTVFYDDGTVRNRLVYWRIDPPEIEHYVDVYNGREYPRTREYTSYYIEIWNQNNDDRNVIIRYRQYGWEVLRETKGAYWPPE